MSITFGKYKGKTIQEAFELDYGYCRWLSKQDMILASKPEIKDFLDDKFKEDDNTYLMRWGKHKGKTIGWVKKFDEKYFKWLNESFFVRDNCPALYKAIQELL